MKHWAFDLDGTLVDSFSHYFNSLETIFGLHGQVFSSELFHDALTHSLDRFFAERLGADAVAPALALLQEHSHEHAKLVRPFDGIPEALQLLKDNGARVAIWTNRDLDSASRILSATGLDRFTELCVSGTCVERKPSLAGLDRIVDSFGCSPSDLIMVGDHEHDVTTPKSAGARGIRASWHAYWKIDACAHADRQFFSVSEFRQWLESQGLSSSNSNSNN